MLFCLWGAEVNFDVHDDEFVGFEIRRHDAEVLVQRRYQQRVIRERESERDLGAGPDVPVLFRVVVIGAKVRFFKNIFVVLRDGHSIKRNPFYRQPAPG